MVDCQYEGKNRKAFMNPNAGTYSMVGPGSQSPFCGPQNFIHVGKVLIRKNELQKEENNTLGMHINACMSL